MKPSIEATKLFVKEKLEQSNRPNYPFRSRYRHTLRVVMWVRRLHDLLGGDLAVLEYSALLHDCDWNGYENHAIASYHTAKEFLDQFEMDSAFKDKILEGVRYHNERDKTGLSKETYMLMDADELDEVGALCILWDAMAEQHENNETSYMNVLKRIKKYIPQFHNNVHHLHFDCSKDIYRRKVAFQEQFIKEAEEELTIELDQRT